MTRAKRLEPIAAFKDRQQKQCLQDMADSKMRWQQQQQQLQNLIDYQEEYNQQQGQANQAPLSAMQLMEYRRFIDQLEQTIKQQGLIVQQAQREFQLKQKHWLAVKNNAKAVEHLVDNIHHQELQNENKQEQKMLDEFGLRRKPN